MQVVQILKALGDETRLRILGVLKREPLSVNELLEVLSMGQSRVSRHLRILSDVGILEGSRAGSRIYYGFPADMERAGVLFGLLQSLGLMGGSMLHLSEQGRGDLERLELVLEGRKRRALDHFETVGREQDRLQQGLLDVGYYRRRIVEFLAGSAGVTVDLGCGTGELAALLAGRVGRLICVDQSSNMLDAARATVGDASVEYRLGALEHLPLGDGEADVVVASMVLHHLPDPLVALRECARVLKRDGTLVLAELKRHEEEIMRTKFADFWLGFEAGRLRDFLRQAGFEIETRKYGKGEGKLDCMFLKAGLRQRDAGPNRILRAGRV